MSALVAAGFAAGLTALVWYLLFELFHGLDPAGVRDYVPCAGDWNEARMNGCANGLNRLPQQPVNTYTNLAYLASSAFVALSLMTAPAYVLGVASFYHCLGSALYHGTSTRWGGYLDISGMFAVFGAIAAYAVCILLGVVEPWLTAAMIVIAVFSGLLLRKPFRNRVILLIAIFLVLIYGAAAIGLSLGNNRAAIPWLIASFVVFLVAFVIWNLDKAGNFPLPRWGHGFWHLLTAGGIALVFYGTDLLR
jgi:predicted membrane channel-forming protein YqfA (hemolysin III family)